MARALLGDSLENGTFNWDITVYKTLSIVLISTLGARSGDVALSTNYGVEYLRYEHIRIVRLEDDGEESIGMHIDLQYQKGHK